MADPFLGEIRMFGGNFAPAGWATCDGQLLPISQNTALFSLLGTSYGGNGQTTFGLPDLRGRIAINQSGDLPLGQSAGAETATLASSQLPGHNHPARCATAGTSQSPAGQYWAADPNGEVAAYNNASDGKTLSTAAVGLTGGGQAHENMQPFLAISFIIALQGIYPSRS